MSGRSAKSNNRGSDLFGYFVSGKYKEFHTNQFAASSSSLVGHTATGGVISDYADGPTVYRAHIFASSGTFEVNSIGDFGDTVDYLIVGGGGGGGGNYESGGGGAGGYRATTPEGPGGPSPSAESSYTISTGNYTVTVGAGGARGDGITNSGSTLGRGRDGGQSAFFPVPVSYPHPTYIRSEGGGGGGAYSPNPTSPNSVPGRPGGSGGGAANQAGAEASGPFSGGSGNTIPGGTDPAPNQGHAGGTRGTQAHGPQYNGSGGGGAGAVGNSNTTNTRTESAGGIGKRTTIVGPAYNIGTPGPGSQTGGWLAGGGGGGTYHTPQDGGGYGGSWDGSSLQPGGPYAGGGNGGNGHPSSVVLGENGTAATGGGGGSGSYEGAPGAGNGGSGIVVVRYQIGELTAQTKASGGNVSFYNNKTIHTFTNSGTFTVDNNGGNPLSIDMLSSLAAAVAAVKILVVVEVLVDTLQVLQLVPQVQLQSPLVAVEHKGTVLAPLLLVHKEFPVD